MPAARALQSVLCGTSGAEGMFSRDIRRERCGLCGTSSSGEVCFAERQAREECVLRSVRCGRGCFAERQARAGALSLPERHMRRYQYMHTARSTAVPKYQGQ